MQDGEALDDVLQLADGARPRLPREQDHRLHGHRLPADPEAFYGELEEVIDEQRNVLPPVAQRRKEERHDVEPPVQLLAEGTGPHHRFEVTVGRSEDAEVDRDRRGPAEPHELALLERTLELRLHGQRQITDLVHEEGARVGLLQQSAPLGDRAGERTGLVAEELALEQRLRDGRALDRHERTARTRGCGVQRACDQLLACSRLSADQDRGVRLTQALDGVEHGSHRRTLADQATERGARVHEAAQLAVLAQRGAVRERTLDTEQQLVDLERLGDVVERTAAHRVDRRADRRVAGHQDHRSLWVRGAESLEDAESVDAGHLQIHDRDVERTRFESARRTVPAVERLDRVAVSLERAAHEEPHALFVVGDEDPAAPSGGGGRCHPGGRRGGGIHARHPMRALPAAGR